MALYLGALRRGTHVLNLKHVCIDTLVQQFDGKLTSVHQEKLWVASTYALANQNLYRNR